MKKIVIPFIFVLVLFVSNCFAGDELYSIGSASKVYNVHYISESGKIYISLDDLESKLNITDLGKKQVIEEKDLTLKDLYNEVLLLSKRVDQLEKNGLLISDGDSDDDGGGYVYITEHGSKYHKKGCGSLGKNYKKVTLKEAKKEHEKCKRCNP
jgi:hypothetical protein